MGAHLGIWTFLIVLILHLVTYAQISALRSIQDIFHQSAFCSCLRSSRIDLGTTYYEYDPDPKMELGTFNGQWELQNLNFNTIAYFLPHSPKHVKTALHCATILGIYLLPKSRIFYDMKYRVPEVEKAPELTILHESESGLVYDLLDHTTGLQQRCLCVAHNQNPALADTCVIPDRPWRILVPYIKMLFGALYLRELSSVKRILMIGLGGGSFPHAYYKLDPDIHMDIIELDGTIVELAQKWFHFNPTPNTKLYIEDGAEFIKRQEPDHYDMVIIDAYDVNVKVPKSISNKKFGKDLLRVLNSQGVAVLNLFNNTGMTLKKYVSNKFTTVHQLRDGHSLVLLAGGDKATGTEEIRTKASKLEREFGAINIDTKWLLEKFDIFN